MYRSFSVLFLLAGSFLSAAASAVPVHRFFNGRYHFYSTDRRSDVNGYRYEGEAFHVHRNPGPDRMPLYRCMVPKVRVEFISIDANCESQRRVDLLGYVERTQSYGAQPLYRCFNSANGDHMTTKLVNECTANGYRVEGTTGFAR